jgi:hypothetical protein
MMENCKLIGLRMRVEIGKRVDTGLWCGAVITKQVESLEIEAF